MKSHVRAAVACVAGSLISRKGATPVYSYAESTWLQISCDLRGANVAVYDYGRNCHVSGGGSGSQYSLYDYGENAHISLSISKDSFTGFFHGDSSHFSGTVNGRLITLYDYAESRHFQYSI